MAHDFRTLPFWIKHKKKHFLHKLRLNITLNHNKKLSAIVTRVKPPTKMGDHTKATGPHCPRQGWELVPLLSLHASFQLPVFNIQPTRNVGILLITGYLNGFSFE